MGLPSVSSSTATRTPGATWRGASRSVAPAWATPTDAPYYVGPYEIVLHETSGLS